MKIKDGQVYGYALATSKNGDYDLNSITKVHNLAIGPKLLFSGKKVMLYFLLFFSANTLPSYLKYRYIAWLDDNKEVIKYTPLPDTIMVPANTTLTLDYKSELKGGTIF